jgi:pyruvate/2-oxoglutarate dehydrogenase complex dihydrolipoamide acyltransferase (E2) component
MLAGCASSASPTQAPAPAAPTAAPAVEAPAANAPEVAEAPAGLNLPAVQPVLRQLNLNIPQDYNTLPTAAVIEEMTGYKVQYDMLPSDAAMDKLNLIMASEESYDMGSHRRKRGCYHELRQRRGAG